MKTEISSLIIVAGVHLIGIAFSTGALKFLNRRISFARTFSHALFAALAANILSSFLWKALLSPGYYWGKIPNSVLILHFLLASSPVIITAFTMVWSVKRQLNAGKQEYLKE